MKKQYAPLPAIGAQVTATRVITERDVWRFAEVSGDYNPIHLLESYAAETYFKHRIAHGLLVASMLSGILGTVLPGEGSIYLGQDLDFLAPVYLGDEVTAVVKVIRVREDRRIVSLSTDIYKKDGTLVISGEATIKFMRELEAAA